MRFTVISRICILGFLAVLPFLLGSDGCNAGEVRVVTRIQPDGRILVSGGFTLARGAPRGGIARFNADGTLDSTFNPGAGIGDGEIRALAELWKAAYLVVDATGVGAGLASFLDKALPEKVRILRNHTDSHDVMWIVCEAAE